MYARGAPHGRGRGTGRGDNFIHDNDFRALRRKVEAMQEEIKRGFAQRRQPVSDEQEETLEDVNQTSEKIDATTVVANDPLLVALYQRQGKDQNFMFLHLV